MSPIRTRSGAAPLVRRGLSRAQPGAEPMAVDETERSTLRWRGKRNGCLKPHQMLVRASRFKAGRNSGPEGQPACWMGHARPQGYSQRSSEAEPTRATELWIPTDLAKATETRHSRHCAGDPTGDLLAMCRP